MKKIMFALMGVMMIPSTSVFAQLSYGVKAGLNLTTQSIKVDDEKVDAKMKPGFNIGAFADYSLSELLSVEAGLNIETKGYKSKETEEAFGAKSEMKITSNIVYLTIPVQARLNFGGFYALVGPYVGIAATGKMKSEVTVTYGKESETEKEDEKFKFGNDEEESDLKRLDFGLGVGAGYEITDNFGVRLGYDLGLANLAPGGGSDYKMKNGSINFSATFKF